MPYYLHAKDQTENIAENNAGMFLTRADAAQVLDPTSQRITFIASEDERCDWRNRERSRFQDGEYFPVPWESEIPYYHSARKHFAHLSTKSPGLIAYTKNDEHGVLDRQTSVRPGRYLEEFFKDVFTGGQIASYIAQCDATHLVLKIATTPDDVERVYTGGPRSCMAHQGGRYECPCCNRHGSGAHYDYQSSEHPSRVYGDSDLAVAYYGEIDAVPARAVIYPAEKRYGRIYGSEVLRTLLEKDGYTCNDNFSGAKLRAIPCKGTYVLPYLDFSGDAVIRTIAGKEWIVIGDASYRERHLETTSCSGLGGTAEDEHEDEFQCSSCGDWAHDDHYGGEGLCQSCYDDQYAMCTECNENDLQERMHSVSDGYICDSCYADSSVSCEVCDESFNPADFSRSETRTRSINGTTELCSDCVDTHRFCADCDEWYDTTAVSEPVSARAEFPGDNTVVDGIRPADFQTPETVRFECLCAECERVIRPDVPDLFVAGIDRTIPAIETDCNAFNAHADIRPVVTPFVAPEGVQPAETVSDATSVFPLPIYWRSRFNYAYVYRTEYPAGFRLRFSPEMNQLPYIPPVPA